MKLSSYCFHDLKMIIFYRGYARLIFTRVMPFSNCSTVSLVAATPLAVFCGFWPGLGLPRPKAIVVIPQNQPLPKHLRKKTSKSAKHACHYATKERPVKITMYLGLDIIIKIKFTTIFDRCAILNVLNYLTKNFES